MKLSSTGAFSTTAHNPISRADIDGSRTYLHNGDAKFTQDNNNTTYMINNYGSTVNYIGTYDTASTTFSSIHNKEYFETYRNSLGTAYGLRMSDKDITVTTANGKWGGTTFTSLKEYLTATRVRHQLYTFTFPSNASTYYGHYYYDIPYTTIGVPTTGIVILGAFVANVTTNIPAFVQCVSSPNAFRVYSNSADIRSKNVSIRVIWEEYTTVN